MSSPATVQRWLSEPLAADVRRALERLAHTKGVVHLAIMPDVHLARHVCIGVVLGAAGRLFPEAVGGDIGCGMAAVRFNCDANILDDVRTARRLLTLLARHVPAKQHASATAVLPDELMERPLSAPRLNALKRRIGRLQFGSLGRGNHFAEFQRGPDGALWLMVHSGSRGMGQAIRDHHLAQHAADNTGLLWLDAQSTPGQQYLGDMQWALDYAQRSRRHMVNAIIDIVDADVVANSYVDCHHNFVRHEVHHERALWVHRKGAISARSGEDGIIPGSMGTVSFHVQGRGHVDSLCSSSHGAGRVMSRTEARRRVSVDALHRQMRGVWFATTLVDRLRDEAPAAYKDIGKVMRAQRSLTKTVRKLYPLLSYKAA